MNASRIVSLLILLIYIGFAIYSKFFTIVLLPLLGMVFIWFPSMFKAFDQLGIYKRGTSMDPNTPSCFFALIGWALMFGPAFIALIGRLADS
ncbi:MAG: hypothetical protein ACQETH_14305 [Candidatus Rifleibacteriota bacterium]